MTFLLDVNLLYILHQPAHPDFCLMHQWFTGGKKFSFATCPMTQAGMLRLLTQRIAGLDVFRMDEAFEALRNLVRHPRHVYWPDIPPYLDSTAPLLRRMQGHRQMADAYLLGLARHHHGRLATLDKAIPSLADPEFQDYVELIA